MHAVQSITSMGYTSIPHNSSVGRAPDMSSEGPVVQVPVTEV